MDMTTPAAFAAVACCSGVKSGSGFDFILNIGLPLGVSKQAQFRTRARSESRYQARPRAPCRPRPYLVRAVEFAPSRRVPIRNRRSVGGGRHVDHLWAVAAPLQLFRNLLQKLVQLPHVLISRDDGGLFA